jgi:glycosyltransferase involved in cell wall biosynthesis
MTSANRPRVAVVLSHPIQHFCPQYTSWAQYEDWEIRVFFASSAGVEAYTDPDYGEEIEWEGIDLDFPHQFLNDGEVLPIDPQLDAPDLETHLGAYNPDVLVMHGYIQKLQRRALHWGYESDVTVLMFSDSEQRQHRPWYKRLAKKLVLPSYIYRKIDGFLTVGDANEDYHLNYGARPDQLFRLSYPIDRDFYDASYGDREALGQEIRGAYDVSPDAAVFSVVGKLVPWKRQKDLIDALARHDASQDVVAFIIGSGEREDMLKRRAGRLDAHRVVFTGFVQPTELPKYYAASDAYVHPSSVEPHSVAISEAVYMGCPAVISDRCGSYGPNDDVQIGRNGFVYPCGDTRTLAHNLERLASSPGLKQRMGKASHRFAVQAQEKSHGEGLRAALTFFGHL